MRPENKPNLRLASLVLVDVAVVLLMTLLVARGVVPLYPGAVIGYPLLFVINLVWVWARNHRRVEVSTSRRPVPLSLWIVAAVFTSAGIAGVVAYLRSPTMPLGVQAAVAILLVGYLWFLIYRLSRGRQDQVPK